MSEARQTQIPAPHGALRLNGFALEFSSDTVTAYASEIGDPVAFRDLRDQQRDSWFLYWRGGVALGIPRTADAPVWGTETEITVADHLSFISALVADTLPKALPHYNPYRVRPFTFVGKKNNLVAAAAERLGNVTTIVSDHFSIRPRYSLDSKIVAFGDSPLIGLFVDVGMRWDINASIEDLRTAGIDLRGLYVVKRQFGRGERRLVGRIADVDDEIVRLADAYDDATEVATTAVQIEGSRASFARCLKTLLGESYRQFDAEREWQETRFISGPAIEQIVTDMGNYVNRASPLDLGGITCSIHARLVPPNSPTFRSVHFASPVEYCYDAARSKRHKYAWPGLQAHGPFSQATFPRKSPRTLVICPDTAKGQAENFLHQLKNGVTSDGGKVFGGLDRTFGLVNTTFDIHTVATGNRPINKLAELYVKTIGDAVAGGVQPPDVAIVVVPDTAAELPDDVNPYLHAKAHLLLQGIASQEVRTGTLRRMDIAYVMQSIAIALYAKMSGTPWTVDQDLTIADEIVIGMGSCEVSGSRFQPRKRYVGITTVFRGDGSYLLSNIAKECPYEEYPDTLRESMLAVLREVKDRNGWKSGDTVRIVVHAYKPFKSLEVSRIVADAVGEVGSEQRLEFAFLTVAQDHSFALIDTAQQGKRNRKSTRGVNVPERGTIVHIGPNTRLLACTGPALVKRDVNGLPRPLLVHLHPESTFTDLTYLTEQVLKFTSLSWRSTMPARRPVTIYYSELIAKLLVRLRNVPGWSATPLDGKLRTSRWFL